MPVIPPPSKPAAPANPPVVVPPGSTPGKVLGFPNYLQSQGLVNTSGVPMAFQYQPKTVDTTYTTQTSPQDISSMINSAMQQLVGRFATPQEIATYGAELRAAEKQQPNRQHSELIYDNATSKPLTQTGTFLTQGVDATAFIQNLINGTAGAKEYRIANTYMDSLQQMTDKYKGSFSG